MADDGEEQGRVREDGGPNEREPLLNIQPPHSRFRQGRQSQNAGRWTVCSGLILPVFKAFFCSLGLWGNQTWNYIPRVLFFMTCMTQAVFQISADCGCPYFDCNYTYTSKEFLPTREMCFTIFSLAAYLSYSIFLVCLIVSSNRDSSMMSPCKTMADVVDRKEITLLFVAFIIIFASYLSGMV